MKIPSRNHSFQNRQMHRPPAFKGSGGSDPHKYDGFFVGAGRAADFATRIDGVMIGLSIGSQSGAETATQLLSSSWGTAGQIAGGVIGAVGGFFFGKVASSLAGKVGQAVDRQNDIRGDAIARLALTGGMGYLRGGAFGAATSLAIPTVVGVMQQNRH